MAYPKNTINVGAALEVIASDTIPIPTIGITPVSGTTTGTGATNKKLIDSNENFILKNIRVGDIVYNTTNNTVATVESVDGETELTLSTNIMQSSGQTYTIYLGSPSKSSDGCLLYVGSNQSSLTTTNSFVDLKVKTTAKNIVTFNKFRVGQCLPVQVLQLFYTGTDIDVINSCVAIW
jgi:hypothetical protein